MYKRRYRDANVWKETVILDPLLKEHCDNLIECTLDGTLVDALGLEDFFERQLFVGAYDVSPEDHMKVQASVQKYIDQSVSKTINLPSTYTGEDLAPLALKYAPYLKGMTIYRAASKENEPLEIIPLTRKNLIEYINKGKVENLTANACSMNAGGCE